MGIDNSLFASCTTNNNTVLDDSWRPAETKRDIDDFFENHTLAFQGTLKYGVHKLFSAFRDGDYNFGNQSDVALENKLSTGTKDSFLSFESSFKRSFE